MKPIENRAETPALDATAGSLPNEDPKPDLRDPRVVLSVLETDQVVAAKQRTRFGRRNLSFGVRLLLWGLRVYVLAMLVLVAISVLRAIHSAH